MNEKMEELITTSSEKLLAYIETTEDFLGEQTPLLIEEILRFSFWEHSFMAVLWAIELVITIGLLTKYFQWIGKREDWQFEDFEYGFPFCIVMLISLPTSYFAIESIFEHTIETIQITIAPRMWLLEYLREIV